MSGGGLLPGAVVGVEYCLARHVGEGGMGHVWEATHTSTGKRFALKILKGAKDEDRRRFQREVRAASALRHPNVITVHDFIELSDGTPVIVMDLLEGETLGAVLRRDGRIALRDLCAVLVPVLGALEAAHALGIVHRDLKPDNVFLCGSGAELSVVVLDFGVAKLTATEGLAAQTQALTGTGSMVGTPYYMSPEQVFADKDLDGRADIWSLAVVMYECLTGMRPTEADTVGRVLQRIMVADFDPVTAHCAGLPEDLASVIGHMLSLDREDRPALAAIKEVISRHVVAGPPSFSRATSTSGVDPTAATVPTPDASPSSPKPLDAARSREESGGRITTNGPVSVLATRPARTRARVMMAGGFATVALIGGAIALESGSTRSAGGLGDPPSTSPMAASEPPSAIPKLAMAPVASVAEPSPIADSSVATSSTPDAGTVRRKLAADVSLSARVTIDGGATPASSAVVCEPREVATNGHCCPRGHVWSFGRCERPFATTF